jgi:hypothetical protein
MAKGIGRQGMKNREYVRKLVSEANVSARLDAAAVGRWGSNPQPADYEKYGRACASWAVPPEGFGRAAVRVMSRLPLPR